MDRPGAFALAKSVSKINRTPKTLIYFLLVGTTRLAAQEKGDKVTLSITNPQTVVSRFQLFTLYYRSACPLYPRKRTCAVQDVMSAKGQKRTCAIHSITSSARPS